MRWRRLCIDLDDDGNVLGGSIEHYNDKQLDPNTTVVLARAIWDVRSAHDLLDYEIDLGWPQLTLPFVMHPSPPSA